MTGFGDASGGDGPLRYFVEIRSLNSRYFKAVVKLPEAIQALEAELEALLRRRLKRGFVTLSVKASDTSASAAWLVNEAALRRYIEQAQALASLGEVQFDAAAMLALPGALQPAADDHERLEQAREALFPLVEQACTSLEAMRAREGEALQAELQTHLAVIETSLAQVRSRAPAIVEAYEKRLRERIERLLHEAGVVAEGVDIVREVAMHAEKCDIAEEVARLAGHLEQFRALMDRDNGEPVGRTLDFLAQEMLREANTIAGKSNDAEVSREIVLIKGAIDRIKEQAQNVE